MALYSCRVGALSILRGLAPALLAASLAALWPTAAAAAPAPLVGGGSGLCLDVKGASSTPGAIVQVYTCNGGSNQQWSLTAAGELRTLGGTRCLDAKGAATAAGTPLISWTCNGQANQRWTVVGKTIRGAASGLCMDVVNGSTQAGAPVQLWTCHGGANQVWNGLPASTDTQAPTPPSGLKVSDLACRSAVLTWSASTDNVGVAFYDIYHDGQLMTSVAGTALSASLTLNPGVTWGLYVNARDAAGNVSQASATLSTVVPQCSVDTQAPTVPTGLAGTVTGTTAALTWKASTDNVAVTFYDVYRNDALVGSTPNTSFTDSGLAPNTAYRYAVAARDAQKNVSARGTSLTLTTGASCSSAVCAVSQVATDTDIPWGLVTLPDGSIVYSRRDAQDIVRLDPATGTKTTLGTVPNVQSTDGEGGLLGLAITPGFPATDPWLYIYHTSPTDNRIVRIQVVGNVLKTTTLQVLLSGIGRNKFHNGGRLRFGPDGKLYASVGDAQNGANAQDLNSLNGKILRLNSDGSRPGDNPFANYVWSYGHRNPQGLAFDSQGRLWEQEFGNSALDETNLIQKGGNYGWPDCEGTISQGGGGCATAGYVAPKQTYATADGSCSGIAIVRDVLYVACERGTRLYREVISGSALTNVQQLFSGTYGRLRTVEPTLDGNLWLTTTNEGDKDSIANNSNEKVLKVFLGN
jgi:glucose/arabinose dehydrogenase